MAQKPLPTLPHTHSSSPPVSRTVSDPVNRHLRSSSADPSSRDSSSQQLGTAKRPDRRKLSRSPHRPASEPEQTAKEATLAWIDFASGTLEYDFSSLINGDPALELWDDCADTFIHLFPRDSGRGPTFKLPSSTFSSSRLIELMTCRDRSGLEAEIRRKPLVKRSQDPSLRRSVSPPEGPQIRISGTATYDSLEPNRIAASGHQVPYTDFQFNLYMPVSLSIDGSPNSQPAVNDIHSLIAIRNLFAFLTGRPLVFTNRSNTIFRVLINISELLRTYNFTNSDGSTHGAVVDMRFSQLIQAAELDDIRASREKSVEALVLAERMRSWPLYNEAFVHVAGKYKDVEQFASFSGLSANWALLSTVTQNRMERASLELEQRKNSVRARLASFEFPSIFAGVLDSKTVAERTNIDFDAWHSAFLAIRRHILRYYKQKFGSWPPKATSKQNKTEADGLNRLVLKQLYADFSSLYDLYVDRTSITPRTMGIMYPLSEEDPLNEEGDVKGDLYEHVRRILRRACDEYDRSSPPVQPPPPFDAPLLPSLSRNSNTQGIKLSESQATMLLDIASNTDMLPPTSSKDSQFMVSVREFERDQVRGCTATNLVDFRAGMWIFIYAVLQALPPLVVDAPGIRWHQGVEYYLCQPPRKGAPWTAGSSSHGNISTHSNKTWYRVSGSQGWVNLPSDLVDHGIDGVYRRSHCWLKAAEWTDPTTAQTADERWSTCADNSSAAESTDMSGPAPSSPAPRGRPPYPSSAPASRAVSPAAPHSRDASRSHLTALRAGLEAIPMPPNIALVSGHTHQRESAADGSAHPAASEGSTLSGSSWASASTASAGQASKTSARTFDDILSSMDAGTARLRVSGKKGLVGSEPGERR